MKRVISVGLVLLVVFGIVALAYMRASEFRSEDTTMADDAASFFVILLILSFIAIAIDYFGDSFLHVTRERQRRKILEPEHAAASKVIDTARNEIAYRQLAPQLWVSRARELAAAYQGEYQAEVARQKSRNTAPDPFLGQDRRPEHEH
ncbi:MAG: hypothetical protein WC538_00460 [Thermoanaerobaculia bacterium]|jgi:hypothetical protein